MSVAQGSLFVQFFVLLWTALRDSWSASLPGRAFARVGRALRHGVEGSTLCQWLWRDGLLVRRWPDSLTCRILSLLLNLPVAIVRWVYEKGRALFDNSLLFRLGSAVCGGAYLFVGLAMVVLLVIPHKSWDNGYALRAMLLVALLLVAGSATRRSWRLDVDALGPYYVVFMGFLVYGFFGSFATSFENGILTGLLNQGQNVSVRFFIFYVIAFLIVLMTVSAVHRPRDLQLLIAVALCGLVVAALYGCYQGYVGVPVVPGQQDMKLNENMPGRVYSFFDNPNNFAEILAMFIPFFAALFLNAKTWGGKLLAVLGAVPCLASIGYTLSRSGWIGLAIAMVVFLMLLNWRFLPLFVVLGLAAIPLLPQSILNRILTIGNLKDSSTQYRFAIYANTTYLLRDYGVRGVGLGHDIMGQAFKVYPTMFDGYYPLHTHNNYLQVWGELGIFGLLSYLAMLCHQIKRGVKAFYSAGDRQVKNLLAAALGGFAGILVIGVAEYTWFYPRNLFLWFFLFAIITCCVKLLRHPKQEASN